MSSSTSRTGWEWAPPLGHTDQPRIDWWVEQVVVMIMARLYVRAHQRGDQQTMTRIMAIAEAAAEAEQAES